MLFNMTGPDPEWPSIQAIDAAYQQLRTWGVTYVPQMAEAPLAISEWRDREMKRFLDRQKASA